MRKLNQHEILHLQFLCGRTESSLKLNKYDITNERNTIHKC